jgi:hypothetical protein
LNEIVSKTDDLNIDDKQSIKAPVVTLATTLITTTAASVVVTVPAAASASAAVTGDINSQSKSNDSLRDIGIWSNEVLAPNNNDKKTQNKSPRFKNGGKNYNSIFKFYEF